MGDGAEGIEPLEREDETGVDGKTDLRRAFQISDGFLFSLKGSLQLSGGDEQVQRSRVR